MKAECTAKDRQDKDLQRSGHPNRCMKGFRRMPACPFQSVRLPSFLYLHGTEQHTVLPQVEEMYFYIYHPETAAVQTAQTSRKRPRSDRRAAT